MTNYSTILVLKSLADEMRLSIVQKLINEGGEVSGREIIGTCANFLKLSQPTMSHHLNYLVRSGVIRERKVGTEKHYRLNHALLDEIGINPSRLIKGASQYDGYA